jgi:putative MATE family efflux protein
MSIVINEKSGKAQYDHTEGSIIGSVLRMGLPSMIGFGAGSVYDVVDMIWVSRLPGAPVAALTFFFPFLWLVSSVNMIAGAGSVAVISRRYGEKDLRLTEAAIKDAILLKLAMALVVGVLGLIILRPAMRLIGTTPEAWEQAIAYGRIYLLGLWASFSSFTMYTALRGVGDPNKAMLLMLSGVALNMLLDPLFIFGPGPFPELGIAGAALATVIAYTFTFLAGLAIFYSGRSRVRLHLRGGLPVSLSRMGRMLRIGFPSGINSLSFSLGRTVIMPMLATYGTEVVAAFGMAQRITGFGIMLIVGMGLGLSALIGQNIGAGKPDRAWRVSIRSIQFTAAANLLFALVLILLAVPIAGSFFGEASEIAKASLTLRILAAGLPLVAVGILLEMSCSGAGENRVPLFFSMISTWALQVPLIFLATRVLELEYYYAWWGFFVSALVSPAFFWIYFRRRTWLHRQV